MASSSSFFASVLLLSLISISSSEKQDFVVCDIGHSNSSDWENEHFSGNQATIIQDESLSTCPSSLEYCLEFTPSPNGASTFKEYNLTGFQNLTFSIDVIFTSTDYWQFSIFYGCNNPEPNQWSLGMLNNWNSLSPAYSSMTLTFELPSLDDIYCYNNRSTTAVDIGIYWGSWGSSILYLNNFCMYYTMDTDAPTLMPTIPTMSPTDVPTMATLSPSHVPTVATNEPSQVPSNPSLSPTVSPTAAVEDIITTTQYDGETLVESTSASTSTNSDDDDNDDDQGENSDDSGNNSNSNENEQQTSSSGSSSNNNIANIDDNLFIILIVGIICLFLLIVVFCIRNVWNKQLAIKKEQIELEKLKLQQQQQHNTTAANLEGKNDTNTTNNTDVQMHIVEANSPCSTNGVENDNNENNNNNNGGENAFADGPIMTGNNNNSEAMVNKNDILKNVSGLPKAPVLPMAVETGFTAGGGGVTSIAQESDDDEDDYNNQELYQATTKGNEISNEIIEIENGMNMASGEGYQIENNLIQDAFDEGNDNNNGYVDYTTTNQYPTTQNDI